MAVQFGRLVDFASDKLQIDSALVRYSLMVCSALPVAMSMYSGLTAHLERHHLNKKRTKYQQYIKSRLEKYEQEVESKITEEKALGITELSFEDLSLQLKTGQLTCITVLHAYQRVAVKNNKTLNFITEPIDDAEEKAKELDELDLEARKKLPLYGIPFSVKENYHLTDYDCTIGCARFIDRKCTGTAGCVQACLAGGAVAFIRTNIPQTMMSLASHNPIYGVTRNPLDSTRTPGGSSAGEGAAIGSGSSMFGLGSDIGGSVRVPAAWCGIYAIKPTVGRFSRSNMSTITYGQMGVQGTSGVMSRDMPSLIAMTEVLCSEAQYDIDTSIAPLAFNQQVMESEAPLTIAFALDYEPITTTESTKQAIVQIMAELRSQGHKVVEWKLPKTELSPDKLTLKSYFGDHGGQILRTLNNDQVSHVIKPMYNVLRIPVCLKKILASLFSILMPSHWFYRFLYSLSGVDSVDDWFMHQLDVKTYRGAWLADWKEKGIDVLITPSVPVPAEIIVDLKKPSSGCGTYVYLMNLVNFPSGVVPFGEITREEEQNDLSNYPEDSFVHRNLKQHIVGSAGLVKSVQCTALPFREEKCLRVMKIISKMTPSSQ